MLFRSCHCDRAILLEGGVVHQEGPPKDVANTYLDLMFGVTRDDADDVQEDASAAEEASPGVSPASNGRAVDGAPSGPKGQIQTLSGQGDSAGYCRLADRIIQRAPGRFEDRAGYNPDEFRWGSQEVEIQDFLVTTNGTDHTVSLTTGQTVSSVCEYTAVSRRSPRGPWSVKLGGLCPCKACCSERGRTTTSPCNIVSEVPGNTTSISWGETA